MKTTRNNIISLTAAAIAMIAGTVNASAAERALILLQENSSGKSYLDEETGDTTAIDRIIDTAVELGETAKFRGLATGRYTQFIDLSDTRCTRANLLNTLIDQTNRGRVIDLAILGHGNTDTLRLNDGNIVGSPTFSSSNPRSIRGLLAEAKTRQNNPAYKFNLRLVHMCNCFGATLNDDWLAIGAKTSVGAPLTNWMPEPMTTFFWDDFVKNDKRASQAAQDSLAFTRPFFALVPGYLDVDPEIGLNRLDETRQTISGDRNLIFKDEMQLKLNQQKSVVVLGKSPFTFGGIYLVAGQRYQYTATGSWKSGPFAPTDSANGHTPGFLDAVRRHQPSNMMKLVGERFNHNNNSIGSFVNFSGFGIGSALTGTAGGHGFLNLFGNDIVSPGFAAYNDNSGSVTVTIKRVQ